jgi:hypothetical protein
MIIRYKYDEYLPECRTDAGVAVGNWIGGWWEDRNIRRGTPVRCGPDGWLTFDVDALVRAGTVIPGRTYCVNFRTQGGAWGQHGAFGAPGLGSIMVPATDGNGMNIGFRVVGGQGGYVVEFTGQEHGWRAC